MMKGHGSGKRRYRVRNWSAYHDALVKRGRLTLWFDEEAIAGWHVKEPPKKRGGVSVYTDTAILCGLTLRVLFKLPLRALQGLVGSVIDMLGLPLLTPDYSTFCRRQKGLNVPLPRQGKRKPLHMVVDSTGLKVFGEGEWKVRQHGWSKRRTWRKLHLGVNEASGELVAATLTANDKGDSEMLPDLLDQCADDLVQVSGDGGYDTWRCYEAIAARGARAAIPPQRNAKIKQHGNRHAPPLPRDEALRRIRQVGRTQWKRESGYHRRSLAETAVARIKGIFGGALMAACSRIRRARLWPAVGL
ncbi:transposase, IS4 family [Magnetococcus marinus MC-1]|uniref:Transposase, IS4 family n=1 Tax=Magnetococcus marinus (strain ATCC BAA-1437 / JCM 17883 / MC-1) TaxID=156889 RepID=A0LBD9_MAGMM|nr:transposase, IS4 family [Magnetococcus marinus MC-1]